MVNEGASRSWQEGWKEGRGGRGSKVDGEGSLSLGSQKGAHPLRQQGEGSKMGGPGRHPQGSDLALGGNSLQTTAITNQ